MNSISFSSKPTTGWNFSKSSQQSAQKISISETSLLTSSNLDAAISNAKILISFCSCAKSSRMFSTLIFKERKITLLMILLTRLVASLGILAMI